MTSSHYEELDFELRNSKVFYVLPNVFLVFLNIPFVN